MFACSLIVATALADLPSADAVHRGVLARMDANGDGALSVEEYGRYDMPSNFDRIDADHDGRATAAELGAWVAATPPRPNPGPPPGAGARPGDAGPPEAQPPAVRPPDARPAATATTPQSSGRPWFFLAAGLTLGAAILVTLRIARGRARRHNR